MAGVILKMAGGILIKLLTEKALTELFIWGAKQLASSTKTQVDDDLVKIIEKHLGAEELPK